jgi:hypothetical protein
VQNYYTACIGRLQIMFKEQLLNSGVKRDTFLMLLLFLMLYILFSLFLQIFCMLFLTAVILLCTKLKSTINEV